MATKSKARRSSKKAQGPTLQELLVLELQEIHSAENQLSRMIPRITKAVDSESLRTAVEQRAREASRSSRTSRPPWSGWAQPPDARRTWRPRGWSMTS